MESVSGSSNDGNIGEGKGAADGGGGGGICGRLRNVPVCDEADNDDDAEGVAARPFFSEDSCV